jgi:hypothetical protein
MLRSNPSALPDVRAWAATLLSLLIFLAPHARTSNAINLLDTHSISPFTEIPWLPFGKIYGATRHRSHVYDLPYSGNQYETFTRMTSWDGAPGIARRSRPKRKSPIGTTSARFSFQTT